MKIKPGRFYFYNLIRKFLPETHCFPLKSAMLRWCGARIGRNVRICSSAAILGNGALEIGDDVWIGEGCFIKTTHPAKIKIGSCCDIAPQTTLATGTHVIDATGAHVAGTGKGLPITIGDGCWLGLRCSILPGVELPPRTLVAAGAVVVRPPDAGGVLVAGVPAREIRKL